MPSVPARVADRIANGIKRFQPILTAAKSRDVGESDTVTIVVDMLAEIFGYDKYSEITSEHAIRGTFCDLATKLDGVLQMLIEVKAVGLELKDQHVKQAIDYAANQGVDWVILTNGMIWRVYKITYSKPIDAELVVEIAFASLNAKSDKDVECLYLFAKEGWLKSVLGEYHSQKQALSRFFLGAMVLSDPVLEVIRRDCDVFFPDVRIDVEEIRGVLTADVIKREVLEGEKADERGRKSQGQRTRRCEPKPRPKRTRSSCQSNWKPDRRPTLQIHRRRRNWLEAR
ncbi:MAG: type I restriction enzyme HsdR N-terminal domain-containing protein [Planctomycetales bacterium]